MRTRWAVLLAAAGLIFILALRGTEPATRFLHYYRSLEKAEGRTRLWERVVYSLVLTASPAPQPQPISLDRATHARPISSLARPSSLELSLRGRPS